MGVPRRDRIYRLVVSVGAGHESTENWKQGDACALISHSWIKRTPICTGLPRMSSDSIVCLQPLSQVVVS